MKKKYYKNYLNPSLAVDVVIFTVDGLDDNKLKVLVVKRDNTPFKDMYGLPGGFLLEKENTKIAATRILKDKAGVSNIYIEQLYTFDDLNRDPRGPIFSVTYFALVPKENIPNEKNSQFVSIKKLSKLAFDHNKIIEYSVERLRAKLEYTNVSYSLLPSSFTLTELQNIYESISDKKIDKRNFRKKMSDLKFIEETGKTTMGGRRRPAKLYKFTSKKLLTI